MLKASFLGENSFQVFKTFIAFLYSSVTYLLWRAVYILREIAEKLFSALLERERCAYTYILFLNDSHWHTKVDWLFKVFPIRTITAFRTVITTDICHRKWSTGVFTKRRALMIKHTTVTHRSWRKERGREKSEQHILKTWKIKKTRQYIVGDQSSNAKWSFAVLEWVKICDKNLLFYSFLKLEMFGMALC